MTTPTIGLKDITSDAAGGHLSPKSWLDYEHKEYKEKKERWQYIRDLYTGDLLLEDRIRSYLVKKSQGEPEVSYNERVRIADYTNHFGMLVDSLAGILFMTEPNTTRKWHNGVKDKKGLGDETDPNSVASRLLKDADGNGHGWLTIWKDLALELTAYHKSWVLVDVPGLATVRVVNVLDVPNWLDDGTTVLLREKTDIRGSIQDDPELLEEQFLKFDLDGWTRWKRDKEGNAIKMEGPGASGSYSYLDSMGRACLPIFPVDITMKRMVGYSLARKACAIFNLESSIDWILWTANFPKLNIMGGEETFQAVEKSLLKGDNILQNEKGESGHHYITADVAPAKQAAEQTDRKTKDLFISGFREYGDSARERVTATEVRQDVAAGAGAYLTLLKASLEGAEAKAGLLIEQAEFKDRAFKELGGFTVERSEDFMPFDIHSVMERTQKRYFGTEPIPAGRGAKVAIIKQMLKWEGLPVEENDIKAALDTTEAQESLLDHLTTLSVPAEAQAEVVVRILTSLGMFTDGSKLSEEDVRKKVIELVTAKEEAASLEAQTFRTSTTSPRTQPESGGSEHARDPIPSADGRLTE
jgi:hypothetical protein